MAQIISYDTFPTIKMAYSYVAYLMQLIKIKRHLIEGIRYVLCAM